MIQKLLNSLDELAPLVRANISQADRSARLPKEVAAALARHQLFRLWIPRQADGLELSLPEALQVYEAAARIDGSVGWAVMIGSGGGLFAAWLNEATARTLFCPPHALIAGSGAADGIAERVAGGYRVSGRWRYASGADHATTFTANCRITANGVPVLADDGRALIRAMAFDASQVQVIPTWDTSGVRGTGSDDFEVREAFVPEAHTFSVIRDPPRETGPLYRLPFGVLTELPVSTVVLGIARHALEAIGELAARKKGYGSDQLLAHTPLLQTRFAEAWATWQMVKAGVDAMAARAWWRALANQTLSAYELAEITAGCALSVARLRTVVGELIALCGMTGIHTHDEIARGWRDLQAVAAHGSVSPLRLGEAGARLLGRA
jgi:alkylation response protein AidB-like acyl-CoA dehydrogenase